MAAPRLLVDAALGADLAVPLDEAQTNYLIRVLRLGAGAGVRLFNGRDGEWEARIEHVGKRQAIARCGPRLRAQAAGPDAWLLFAPVKRQGVDWIVEKAVELGVSAIQPVLTRRTHSETLRLPRLEAIAREAAEQCERLEAPPIRPPAPLPRLLEGWDPARPMVFADEAAQRGGLAPAPRPARFAVLVGPEGGFAPEERAAIAPLPFVRPVTLGPRILRAETAVAAALTLAMAAWGDWGDASVI